MTLEYVTQVKDRIYTDKHYTLRSLHVYFNFSYKKNLEMKFIFIR
jgi:hypothetical protein